MQSASRSATMWLSAALLLLGMSLPHVLGEESSYGADKSWPIHHAWTNTSETLTEDCKTAYERFMDGCGKQSVKNAVTECDLNENFRLKLSLTQPSSMVNFTDTGYSKVRASESLRKLLTEHFDRNKDDHKDEAWTTTDIYVNHWEEAPYLVSLDEDETLKEEISDYTKNILEHWTGMELRPISLYGIRVYTNGAILSPHVDRYPLVSSCIINVAQDVDEPWPLEVYDRQGKAVNVTMEPGDMVLYESHSLIHGRPFPLRGRYFANIFVHFEPTGKRLYHRKDEPVEDGDDDLPPYILKGSPAEPYWREQNPRGKNKERKLYNYGQRQTLEGHLAADSGDLDKLAKLAAENEEILSLKDQSGWQPIHEAARAGNLNVVEFLVERGVDIHARTNDGEGDSPLDIAVNTLGSDHPVPQYLLSLGAHGDYGAEL